MPTRSNPTASIIKAAVISAAFLTFSLPLAGRRPLKGPAPEIRHELPRPYHAIDTVSILFLGDMMMHTRQLDYDSRTFLRELEPLIAEADLTVANAEFTLAGPPYKGYPRFSAPETYVRDIRASGVDLLLTANNHILDYGSEGLAKTLRKIGEPYCGSGEDSSSFEKHNPLILRLKSIKVGFVNFCYGTNLGPTRAWPKTNRMDREAVSAQLKRCETADFVVALPHWGEEYRLRHGEKQEAWAQFLVSEGADAVVGAHPHVVQDTAFIGKVPVIYSLGNAVSNMSAPNTRLELALMLRMVCSRPDGACRMLEPELHFLWCCLPGKLNGSYCTIPIKDYIGRRDLWRDPSDYDEMLRSLRRVLEATKIGEPLFLQ